MLKKTVALLLALLMIFALAACGGDKDEFIPKDGYIVKSQSADDVVNLGSVKSPLDPKSVYDKLSYTAEMFYGDYRLEGGENAQKLYAADAEYAEFVDDGKQVLLSTVPFQFRAGNNSYNHVLKYIDGYNWMEAKFYQKTEDGEPYLTVIPCAYTVEGKKLILKPVKSYTYDEKNKKMTYEFEELTWEYDFKFSGRSLTLSKGGKSVTMKTGLDAYGEKLYLYSEGYLSPDAMALDSIDKISLRYEKPSEAYFYIESISEERVYNAIGKITENGLFTFTVPWKSGTKTYQYVYFMCGYDGIVLTDGTNIYYYNDSYSDRNSNTVSKFLTEDQTGKLSELTEQEIEAIVEKKENLMDDLAKAFGEAGIKVNVDERSGELQMDSSILFGGDSAVLTADGKTFLNKFVKAYNSIVFSEKYKDFVSKTMVEGHTAPIVGSTYESGLPLSVQRAENVKSYCISSKTGIDTSKLASSLEAVGYSNSKPVKDSSGKVDMAASRRVSFRFIINLGK